jgi:hypothetical protein
MLEGLQRQNEELKQRLSKYENVSDLPKLCWTGINVMSIIFDEFDRFSAEKMAAFLEN